jgi:hypothetical protein
MVENADVPMGELAVVFCRVAIRDALILFACS